ncbi:MAG: HAD family hydrolase [Methanosarcinales archaeon]|nr:HAD family hydrolase [Methanosarcinales archaeon]
MIKVISFDMDGTLVSPRFVDRVWMDGVPGLYAERHGLDLEEARRTVVDQYMKIGSDHLEWYNLQYWLDRFDLDASKYDLLDQFAHEVEVFPEVEEVLEILSGYQLVITSNAAREFIEVELDGLADRFDQVFSATSDFCDVKKSASVYMKVCWRMGRKPLEVLHIGDHYVYDYQSPLEAGLDAIFLDRKGEAGGREVVCDLREAAEHILNYA